MTPEIRRVLKYFSHFSYPPSEDEIYAFLKKKASKEEFDKAITSLVAKRKLRRGHSTGFDGKKMPKYTLEEYGIFLNENRRFSLYSQSKLKHVKFYISVLKNFPQVRFVGVTGTISMMHAKKEDDIDLFIITAKKRLWTGRFITNILAFLLGLKRKRLVRQAKDKICLNLFFEESGLRVPDFKKTEYVAHEVLQVKPLINKKMTYERFLQANKWVFRLFPNAKTVFKNHIKPTSKNIKSNRNSLGDLIEEMVKKIQLSRIQKNKTSEIITKTQLWFFPDDFETKLKRKRLLL